MLNHKTFKYNCNIGLAFKKSGKFKLYSKAPLFKLDDIDPIGTGSMSILKKNYLLMYYVSFDEWVKVKENFNTNIILKLLSLLMALNGSKKSDSYKNKK